MADTAATNGGSAMGNLKGSKVCCRHDPAPPPRVACRGNRKYSHRLTVAFQCFKLAPALPAPRTDDEHATIQQQRPTAYQDVREPIADLL